MICRNSFADHCIVITVNYLHRVLTKMTTVSTVPLLSWSVLNRYAFSTWQVDFYQTDSKRNFSREAATTKRFLATLLASYLYLSATYLPACAETADPLAQPSAIVSAGSGRISFDPANSGQSPAAINEESASPLSQPEANYGNTSPLILRSGINQSVLAKPLNLFDTVQYADQNYPLILKGQAEVQAAKKNVTVQKLNEYLPDSLYQWQEIFASHNKLTQVIFGSPVFPAQSGPGFPSDSMKPSFFSGQGISLDWAPLDFGLHKARINLAKNIYAQSQSNYLASTLDAEIAAASAFLDAVEAQEAVKAAEVNVQSFNEFATIVGGQVRAELKPGADLSLAQAQLANAQNVLYRAQLTYQLAQANLANAIGLGGQIVTVDSTGLTTTIEPADLQKEKPVFENVPIVQAGHAALISAIDQKKILNKEYYPVFHFLGGVQTRGAGLSNLGRSTSADASGTMPTVPDYQVALIINWNFLDYFRLKAEKKVQDARIAAQKQDYNLILQNTQTEDLRSRARVQTALAIAANTPIQVKAAEDASRQAVARYRADLSTVAQVAEANQMLAQSRFQDAQAKVGVWRALLSVAAAHGDMTPFLKEARHIQGGP
jgi:outer membrane protein TolC